MSADGCPKKTKRTPIPSGVQTQTAGPKSLLLVFREGALYGASTTLKQAKKPAFSEDLRFESGQ